MPGLEAVCGPPAPAAFRVAAGEYAGKHLDLSPLRMIDYAELNLYLKGLPLRAIKHHLHDCPSESARFLLTLIYHRVEDSVYDLGTLPEETWARGLSTWPGRAFGVWLSLRRRHPLVTLADVELSIDEKNWDQVGRDLDLVCGFRRSDPKADAGAAATPPPATAEAPTTADRIAAGPSTGEPSGGAPGSPTPSSPN